MSMNDPAPVEIPPRGQFLNNNMYDKLKWVAQIFLPALGALYFGLGQIWGFAFIEEVVGSIAVIDTFLGVLLGLSARQYNDKVAPATARLDALKHDIVGTVVIDTLNPEKDVFSLDLDGHPLEMDGRDYVVFKVESNTGTGEVNLKNSPGENSPQLPGNDG
jgi:hypothetical protein